MDDPVRIDDIREMMGDLRAMAVHLLRGEREADSVRPTALVMSGLRRYKTRDQEWSEITWENRRHCFASLHGMMRRALIDRARRGAAQRRPKLTLVEPADLYNLPAVLEEKPEQVVALEEALQWLGETDAELAELVQHHYFSGVKVGELGRWLEVSEKTVKRKLASARLLLHRKIRDLLKQPSSD